jgi:ElaB/YqjD/DUF883 family membrane-anchored ribosome-binding protein
LRRDRTINRTRQMEAGTRAPANGANAEGGRRMDERATEIVKDILDERQKLGDNLSELETKMREAANWRTYFNRNPWAVMGAALGGGLLLSRIVPPRRNKFRG